MLEKSKNITFISFLITRDGAQTPRIKRGRGVEMAIGFVWSHEDSYRSYWGPDDRGITTRAIDAHTPRYDGAMVEHSECLLAPFRIGDLSLADAHSMSACRKKYPHSGYIFEIRTARRPRAIEFTLNCDPGNQQKTSIWVRHDDKKYFFSTFFPKYLKKIRSIFK